MKSNRAGLEDPPGGGYVRAADKRGEECANPNKAPDAVRLKRSFEIQRLKTENELLRQAFR